MSTVSTEYGAYFQLFNSLNKVRFIIELKLLTNRAIGFSNFIFYALMNMNSSSVINVGIITISCIHATIRCTINSSTFGDEFAWAKMGSYSQLFFF